MKDFLERFIPPQKGQVVDEQGKVIGEHKGVVYYTIGQRHGFLITEKGVEDKPLYIVAKDLEKNILVVSPQVSGGSTSTDELKKILVLEKVNWILGEEPALEKK